MFDLAEPSLPIVDSHMHLFDTARVQGVPYPNPNQTVLWKPAMPDRYRTLAAPLGVVAAVVVEASPWIEDNLWILQLCETNPLMVAVVGNLEPDQPEFGEYLERFQRNPLFRGIRYGNLWGRSLARAIKKPHFLDGLRLVAQAGLSMDTANPDQELLEAVLRVSDAVPDLRIVIDHLPNAARSINEDRTLREFVYRPQIFVKISEVIQRIDGSVQTDVNYYRPQLDQLWDVFGEDRVLFGSDWPNWDLVAPLESVIQLAKAYVLPKGPRVAEKFFSKNALTVYRWKPRQ